MRVDPEPLARLLSTSAAAGDRELLAVATREVVALLGDRGWCVLLDPARAVVLTSETSTELPIDLDRYPEIVLALDTGQVVVVNDTRRDPVMASVRHLLPEAVRATAAVPLLAGTRRVGAILAQSSSTLRPASDEAIATAELVGRAAGRLLDAARQARWESDPARTPPSVRAARPALAEGGGAHPTGPAPEPSQRRWRVLLIEDEPTHAAIVEAVLGRRGYDVEVAESGEVGLRLARERAPDVILLDVLLPALDGFSLAARLKQEEGTRDVPLLFLSACDDVGARVRAIQLGAADYLPKPFYAPELLARVERALVQVEARERLRAQANIDELTGLGNLRHLRERLAFEQSRAVRYATPLALVMMDVDKLKAVNDRHGHVVGSRVLAEVGRVLRDEIRDTDVAVRYGGDEFVVLLPHATAADAARFAERVLARIRSIDILGASAGASDGPRVTVSAGVAGFDHQRPEPMEALLEQADAAAYQAKRAGGDRVFTAAPQPVADPHATPSSPA